MDSRLVWLALGAFAGSVESSVIVGFLPAISAETGVKVGEAGLLVLGYSLAYGFATPVLSTVFGRQHRRRIVVGAEALFGLAAILVALSPGFPLIFAARTLLAVGAGLFTATAQATAVALAKPGEAGRAVSTVVTGGSLAVAIGAPLGALLGNLTSWRVTYFVLGVLALSAAATMWRRLPRTIEGDTRTLRERLSVLREPGVGAILVSSVLAVMGMFIFLIYSVPVTTGQMGIDASLVPVALFAFGGGAVMGNHWAGRMADRIGPWRTQMRVLAATIVSLLAIPVIAYLPMPVRLVVFFLDLFVFGVVTWGFFPPQLLRFVAVAPGSAILVAAVNLTAVNIGGGTAAVIGGQVLEHLGPEALAPVAAAVAGLALLAVRFGPDSRPGPRNSDAEKRP